MLRWGLCFSATLTCDSGLVNSPVGQLLLSCHFSGRAAAAFFHRKNGWGGRRSNPEVDICSTHRFKVTAHSFLQTCGNLRFHIFLVKILSNIASSCPPKLLRSLVLKSRIFLFYAPKNDRNFSIMSCLSTLWLSNIVIKFIGLTKRNNRDDWIIHFCSECLADTYSVEALCLGLLFQRGVSKSLSSSWWATH